MNCVSFCHRHAQPHMPMSPTCLWSHILNAQKRVHKLKRDVETPIIPTRQQIQVSNLWTQGDNILAAGTVSKTP